MLAVITVTSLADNLFADGEVTLREAIVAANTDVSVDGSTAGGGADRVEFAAALSGETITLGAELAITEAHTIDAGDGTDNTFNTGDGFRVFNIDDGTATQIAVDLVGLTLTGGDVSDNGGAILSRENLTIASSTITENRADEDDNGTGAGGGIRISSATVSLNHTLVAGNDLGDPGNTDDDLSGPVVSTSDFNLIGVDTSLSGISHGSGGNQIGISGSPIDPLLGPRANNGGPTETPALLAGSLAIDAGDPSFTSPPEFDQRGAPFARMVGGRIDIGAYELQASVDSADFDNDGDIDGGDFLAWQRGFGTPSANKDDGDADNDADVDGESAF